MTKRRAAALGFGLGLGAASAVLVLGWTLQPGAAPPWPGEPLLPVAHPHHTELAMGEHRRELLQDRTAMDTLPAIMIRGRVLDASTGEPLRRFAVVVSRADAGDEDARLESEPPPYAKWFTAADGGFALPAEGDGPQLVCVWSDGHLAAAAVARAPSGSGILELTLRLARGVTVAGTVVDADGLPVPEAVVSLTQEEGTAALLAATGPDGRFSLPPAAPGRYDVVVDCVARPGLHRAGYWLHGNEAVRRLELVLPRGATVRGLVLPLRRDREGEIVFTHEQGTERRCRVAEDGSYELHGLSPGLHRVRFAAAGTSFRHYVAEQVSAREEGVEIQVGMDGVVSCNVPDAAARLGRVHGTVRAHAQAASLQLRFQREQVPLPAALATWFRTSPGESGWFELDGLPPGRWSLRVHDATGAELRALRFELGAGEDLELRVDLAP